MAQDKLKIVLSARPPVNVREDDWPMIAEATWHSGAVQSQANEKAYVRVRQHNDGRTIVYGALIAGPGGVVAGWQGARAGFLFDKTGSDCSEPHEIASKVAWIVNSIQAVAETIGHPELGADCIADLPPEDLR